MTQQQRQKTNAEGVGDWLEANKDTVLDHAPDHWDYATVKRQAMAIAKDGGWKVQKSTPESIINCVLQAAHLGLDIDAGDTHVVGRKQSIQQNGEWHNWFEADLMHSYKGLIKIALRTPNVDGVISDVVREDDEVEMYRDLGEGNHFRHVPDSPFNSGDIIGSYAIIETKEGSNRLETLSREEIDKIRGKAADDSPAWKEFYGEMSRKAVIRRALKKVDKSPEMQRALTNDDRRNYSFDNSPDADRQIDESNGSPDAERQVATAEADPNERFQASSSTDAIKGDVSEERQLEAEVVDGGKPDPPTFQFSTDINTGKEYGNQGEIRTVYALLSHLDDETVEAFWDAAKQEWGAESRKNIPPAEMGRLVNFLEKRVESGRTTYVDSLI